MNTRDVLEKAVKILDAKGWCQGDAQGEGGTVCAMEAVRQARIELGSSVRVWELKVQAMSALSSKIPEDFPIDYEPEAGLHPIAQYNDDPRTSLEDVRLMFKRAIEEAS